jgi:hypothetical protein
LSVKLRDRIVSRHRSGEKYQKVSAALKVPKNIVASIIVKWKIMLSGYFSAAGTRRLNKIGAKMNRAKSQMNF